MSDSQEARQNQDYTVYLIGGEKITINAHRIFINTRENAIYFIKANDESVEDWFVLQSGVAAIHSSTGKVNFGAKNM